jgi:deoxycytidylate deaminase
VSLLSFCAASGKKIRRGFRYAINAAELSTNDYHRVGSSLWQGSRLISVGWNNFKTHPDSPTRFHAQHSEFNCLVGLHKYDVVGATIFVVRLTRGGDIGIAKPCDICEKMLRAAGIRKVFYSGRDYEVEELKL